MVWLTLDMTKHRELREKVLLEYGAVQSLRAVAKANSVSKSTVSNWVAKARGVKPSNIQQKSQKPNKKPIHGLRHCTKCSQCVNRDKNAARGIFFAFMNHYKHGCMPAFLKMLNRGNKSNSVSNNPTTDSMTLSNTYTA